MRYYTESEVTDFLKKMIGLDCSQSDLAKLAKVSPQFINDVVHGRRSITARVAESIGFEKLTTTYKRRRDAR